MSAATSDTWWTEKHMDALVHRISGKTAIGLTLVLFPGCALILPLAVGASTILLMEMNLIGAVLAACVGLGWMGVQLDAAKRRHLLEWTSDLRRLDASEFEWLVGEVFRREGWTVREVGSPDQPDGNIDLELNQLGDRRIVQCKRWSSKLVGVDEIRLFLGTLLREHLEGKAGIYVTLSQFGNQARKEAEQAGLTLIDNRELFARIEKERQRESCPICSSPMAFGRSVRGWWFRCTANGCSGKRDLGNHPGRAVEILTQSQ